MEFTLYFLHIYFTVWPITKFVTAVSIREIWEDIKLKLSELFDIVYDYLAGMGLEDYKKIAIFLTQNSGASAQLGMIIMETVSSTLRKKILSSLTVA